MKRFILFALAMFLSLATGLRAGELKDEIADLRRKRYIDEAAKKLEQAEQYLELSPNKAEWATLILLPRIIGEYPNTPQAEIARKRLEELGKPYHPPDPLLEEDAWRGEELRQHWENKLPKDNSPRIGRDAWGQHPRGPYRPPPGGERWLPNLGPKPSNLNDC